MGQNKSFQLLDRKQIIKAVATLHQQETQQALAIKIFRDVKRQGSLPRFSGQPTRCPFKDS
jgi:hypothetical protein